MLKVRGNLPPLLLRLQSNRKCHHREILNILTCKYVPGTTTGTASTTSTNATNTGAAGTPSTASTAGTASTIATNTATTTADNDPHEET